MRGLLVDRLGFERIVEDAAGHTWVVPRRFVPGESHFKWYGTIRRGNEEMKRAHSMAEYLRREVRQLEGTIKNLREENGELALELRRSSLNGSQDGT